jgi:hypothetical protein
VAEHGRGGGCLGAVEAGVGGQARLWRRPTSGAEEADVEGGGVRRQGRWRSASRKVESDVGDRGHSWQRRPMSTMAHHEVDAEVGGSRSGTRG